MPGFMDRIADSSNRRTFIGGSDARIIMGDNEGALVRLWREAANKYMPQLQHNMWVVAARSAVLSIISGGGKWVEIKVHADPLYQHLIVTAERGGVSRAASARPSSALSHLSRELRPFALSI